MASLDSLPPEILQWILSPGRGWEGSRNDLFSWRLVCKRWDSILDRHVTVNPNSLSDAIHDFSEDQFLHIMSKLDFRERPDIQEIDQIGDVLLWGAFYGYTRVLLELEAYGLDLYLDPHVYCDDTLEDAALKGGHVGTVYLFLRRGLLSGFELGPLDDALCTAAEHGHPAVVELLLDEGAEVSDPNVGNKALHSAAMSGSVAVIRLLWKEGAELSESSDMESAISDATRNGHEPALRLLLERHSEHYRSSRLSQLLPLALRSENEKTMQLILDAEADVNDAAAAAAVVEAARRGQDTMLEILLDAGAGPLSEDYSQRSSLYHASRNGHENAVRLLFEKIGTIEVTQLETPFLEAVENGHLLVAKLLCERGVGTIDGIVDRALYRATSNGHVEVAKFLLGDGASFQDAVQWRWKKARKDAKY